MTALQPTRGSYLRSEFWVLCELGDLAEKEVIQRILVELQQAFHERGIAQLLL